MTEPWMPSEESILNAAKGCVELVSIGELDATNGIRALIRAAVETALAEQEARHKREVIEARIEELDNATATVCQGCAEGMDYFPGDGSHRRQISDDGDAEGGPCNCHELSDRLHGLRAELAALASTEPQPSGQPAPADIGPYPEGGKG